VSRQAQWGLRTITYLRGKEREDSPEAAALAQALRGLKPLKMFLTTFVRNDLRERGDADRENARG
jgi:hypothetical protein